MRQAFQRRARPGRTHASLLFSCLVLLCGRGQASEPATAVRAGSDQALQLQWRAPGSCPGQAEVLRAMRQIAPPGSEQLGMRVHASVERRGAQWLLQLRTQRGDNPKVAVGKRSLRARDCEALVRAATLVVALAMGEELEIMLPPEPEPTPAPAPPSSVATVKPLRLSLSAGLDSAPLVFPSARLGLRGMLRQRRTLLGLGAHWWPGQTRTVADEVRARIDAGALRLDGCALWNRPDFEARLCAGADLGMISGASRDADRDGRATALFGSVRAGLENVWTLRPGQHLNLNLGGRLFPRPTRFVIEGLGEAHTMKRWGLDLGLAWEWSP